MKKLNFVIPLFITALVAGFTLCNCGDAPAPHFTMMISKSSGMEETRYYVTESSLLIVILSSDSAQRDSVAVFQSILNRTDTMDLIARMQPSSHSCAEQHALIADRVEYQNDSITNKVNIDPNVNHPVELDYMVRTINGIVPDEYQLQFIDMQPAIEPDGKLRL